MNYSDCKTKVLRLLDNGSPVKCYLVDNDSHLIIKTLFFDPWNEVDTHYDWLSKVSFLSESFFGRSIPLYCVEDTSKHCVKLFFYVKGGAV